MQASLTRLSESLFNFLEPTMEQILKDALIRKRDVLKMTGWSNSTLYNRIAANEFKAGVKIGPRMVAWPLSEVKGYIHSCIAKRDDTSVGGAV